MARPSCAGCRTRDRKIERLQREVRRLRRELDTARRQQHRQTAPFRRRQTKQRPRRPGRRHGHPPAQRPTPPPERIDRVIAVPCRHGPDCRVELVDPGTVIQYQTDLPPITPLVTQFTIETGYCAKGQCNGHLLRRTKNLRDLVPQRELTYLDELSHLLQEAIDLGQRRDQLTEPGYNRRVRSIENRLVAWVLAKPMDCSDELRRLHSHLCNHAAEWLVFLHDREVPPTNNQAERMLRPAVITRKVGGCNKTLLGALVHSVLASLMVTCKQQGQHFLDLARRLWQSEEPQAVPLLPPPAT